MSEIENFYIANNRQKKSKKVIGYILKKLLFNKEYEKKPIMEICKEFKICNKTLYKYLKTLYVKPRGQEKFLILSKNLRISLKSLDKLMNSIGPHLTNTEIELLKNYIDNFKI